MKKFVVSAFSLFLLGIVSANAQTTTGGQSGTEAQTSTPSATQGTAPVGTQAGTQSGTQTSTGTTTQTEATSTGTAATGTTTTSTEATPAGTTVALEELPAPVKATLASEKLKTWTPSAAQLMKDADGKEYFSIQLKQANQIGTVKLSKDGKPVK